MAGEGRAPGPEVGHTDKQPWGEEKWGGRGEGLPLGLRSLLTLRPDFGSLLEGSFPGSTCSAPLCEAPSSSPAPTPPVSCLSHCAVSISSPSLGLPVSVSCRLFLSQGSPFFFLSRPLLVCLCVPLVPLSVVPRKLPEQAQDSAPSPSNTCHPSPSSPPTAPLREVPPHRPPIITHPWEPRAPSSTTPSTKPTGPCPSSGHQAVSAKLSSEVAGHPAREGAGPGCPRPSPQLPAPAALIWHCPPGTAWWLGGVPRGLGSAGRLPSSSASFSPSQTSGNTFSAPGSPSLLPPPTSLEPKRPPRL